MYLCVLSNDAIFCLSVLLIRSLHLYSVLQLHVLLRECAVGVRISFYLRFVSFFVDSSVVGFVYVCQPMYSILMRPVKETLLSSQK